MANYNAKQILEPSIWEERQRALETAVSRLGGRCSKLEETPQKQALSTLIAGLKEFGAKQFDYFFDGFGAHQRYLLKADAEFPPENVLATTLDQIGVDIEALEHAIIQREKDVEKATRDRLAQADELARQALVPAQSLLYHQQMAVVTYFQQITRIRVVPYAQAALIGIPFTSLCVARDLLAIPHEVGHFVFWNARVKENGRYIPLRKQLLTDPRIDKDPKLYKNTDQKYLEDSVAGHWLEEIFADVYGAYIGGDTMALDFQDLQLPLAEEGFLTDDGHHPVPAIRPYTYMEALRLKGASSNWEKLDQQWRTRLAARGIRVEGQDTLTFKKGNGSVVFQSESGHEIRLDKALVQSKGMVNAIWEMVFKSRPPAPEWPSPAQSSAAQYVQETADGNVTAQSRTQSDGLQELFKDVEKRIDETQPADMSTTTVTPVAPVEWIQWVKQEAFFRNSQGGEGREPPDNTVEVPMGSHSSDLDDEKQPLDAWARVWLASGWTSGGPNSVWR